MKDMDPTLVAVYLRRHLGMALGDEADVINNAIFSGHPSIAVMGGLALASMHHVALPEDVIDHVRADINWSTEDREELEEYISSLPSAA